MPTGFFRRDGSLTCDGLPVAELAERFGTPLYVYSWAAIAESYGRFDRAFASVRHRICYAAKANSSLAILRRLAGLGSAADVVSGGELRAAIESGMRPERIVFSGVGKTDEEIAFGIEAGLGAFNAESQREIEKIAASARARGASARVALRVNPDIDARSHPYISTGLRQNKFGVDIARARELFRWAAGLPGVRMVGIQAHIGSQILDPEPLAETARDLAAAARSLEGEGFRIETLDLGGGIGLGGPDSRLTPESYASAVLPPLAGLSYEILIEPGRAIVGPAGLLLTRVLYVKNERGKTFVVTDAGMNDLIRPALYGAIHPIEFVGPARGQTLRADVVGPICETSDSFLQDAEIERVEEGDVLALRDVGAYGYAMSSNYNFRPRAAEVLVDGGVANVIRRRETFEDLTRLEEM